MSVTLCLTHDCTLRCAYCYAGEKRKVAMPSGTARQAIDFAVARHNRLIEGDRFVLGFFGGEPLLEWPLLQQADAYAAEKCKAAGLRFSRTATTNLTLLTRERAEWLRARDYWCGFSLDGTKDAHDAFRRYADGRSSFDDCLAALGIVRDVGLRGEIVAVVNPSTAGTLAESVRFLTGLGYAVSVNVNFLASWDDAACTALEGAYTEIADYYIDRYRGGAPVRVTWIDGKIKTHLYGGYHACDKCALGIKELAVAPSGNIYPCPNLVGNDDRQDLLLGNVFTGFDESRRRALASCRHEPDAACRDCPVADRCMNWCGCVNYFSTGDCGRVGGFACFHERLSIRLADRVAETLWKEKNPAFIKAFYSRA
jgi:uncharacterized protein